MPKNPKIVLTDEKKEILIKYQHETNKVIGKRLEVSQSKIAIWKRECGLINKNTGRPTIPISPIAEGMFEHADDWFSCYKP